MQDKEKPSSNALNPPSKTKALHSLTRAGRHGECRLLKTSTQETTKNCKEVANMWWAQTGFKIAYASIVGVWAVLMFVVFT